jgi:putative transposase
MKLEITVAEVKEIFKEIQEQPEQIFEMMRLDIKEIASRYLTALMNAELSHFLGREPYERGEGEVNHRNGSYDRSFTLKNIGEVRISVPRDRQGNFKTPVIPRSRQYEEEIGRDLSLMFLTGISTRTLSLISHRLIGRRISHTEISRVNSELTEAVENWRMRDLSQDPITYLLIDGVNFHMRVGRSIELIPILVAIGVTERGHKLVVGFQAGDKESASSWRNFSRI